MRWYASASPRGGLEADDDGDNIVVVLPLGGLGVD